MNKKLKALTIEVNNLKNELYEFKNDFARRYNSNPFKSMTLQENLGYSILEQLEEYIRDSFVDFKKKTCDEVTEFLKSKEKKND